MFPPLFQQQGLLQLFVGAAPQKQCFPGLIIALGISKLIEQLEQRTGGVNLT